MGKRVPRTRNDGTMTEAQFWGWIRSLLRRGSMRWKPKDAVFKANRRPKQATTGRHKWEYQCENCRRWFPRKRVEAHHKESVGALTCAAEAGRFIERLYVESHGYELQCEDCHYLITQEERERGSNRTCRK